MSKKTECIARLDREMTTKKKCIMRRKLAMACTSAKVSGLLAEAVQHVMIEGITATQAEKEWYGAITNTVGRAVNKVKVELHRFESFGEIK